MSIPCTTSDVLFMPYITKLENTKYVATFFIGMGLSALVPSAASLIQGRYFVLSIWFEHIFALWTTFSSNILDQRWNTNSTLILTCFPNALNKLTGMNRQQQELWRSWVLKCFRPKYASMTSRWSNVLRSSLQPIMGLISVRKEIKMKSALLLLNSYKSFSCYIA